MNSFLLNYLQPLKVPFITVEYEPISHFINENVCMQCTYFSVPIRKAFSILLNCFSHDILRMSHILLTFTYIYPAKSTFQKMHIKRLSDIWPVMLPIFRNSLSFCCYTECTFDFLSLREIGITFLDKSGFTGNKTRFLILNTKNG